MARIAGINIPPNQHAVIGLTAIYGIGLTRARDICDACGIPQSKLVKDLNDEELEKIRDAVSKFVVEGDLRREIQLSIKRLIDLGTYRGIVAVCPAVVSVPAPMPVPARARARLVSRLRSNLED